MDAKVIKPDINKEIILDEEKKFIHKIEKFRNKLNEAVKNNAEDLLEIPQEMDDLLNKYRAKFQKRI